MKKSRKKTFSVSFPRELVNEIDESCETGDYDCRNSWMKQAVEDKLELEASIDQEEQESQEQEPLPGTLSEKKSDPQKITVYVSPEEEEGLRNGTLEIKQKPVEAKVIKISNDDGKTWYDAN